MRQTLALVTAFMMMAYPLGAIGAPSEEKDQLFNAFRVYFKRDFDKEKEREKTLNEIKKTMSSIHLGVSGLGLGIGLTIAGTSVLQEDFSGLITGIGVTLLCARSFSKSVSKKINSL